MLQLIDRYQTENIHSFVPKSEAIEDFVKHANDLLLETVWNEDCQAWYKNNGLGNSGFKLWPGSSLHYFEAIKELRADDWEIRYNGNRFSWLGNGLSQVEFDSTSDLAYYITQRDESPYASRGKRREVLSRSGTRPSRELHSLITE